MVRVTIPTASPAQGIAGSPVTFFVSATVEGCTLGSYVWNFGDGTPDVVQQTSSLSSSVSHTYGTPGVFVVGVTAVAATGDAKDAQTLSYRVPAISLAPKPTDAPTPLPVPTEPPLPSGGGGGGCDGGIGNGAAVALLGLLPLLLWRKQSS